jgi:hypothetical protein
MEQKPPSRSGGNARWQTTQLGGKTRSVKPERSLLTQEGDLIEDDIDTLFP